MRIQRAVRAMRKQQTSTAVDDDDNFYSINVYSFIVILIFKSQLSFSPPGPPFDGALCCHCPPVIAVRKRWLLTAVDDNN